MSTLVLPITLVAGTNENVNDLNSNLNAIVAWANGNVDATNIANAGVSSDKLSVAVSQQLGLTNAGNVGRGATNIATSESRTNVAYGTLTTPDQVASIVLPTNGYIAVMFKAIWQESVVGAARAAIFVGANQIKNPVFNAVPAVQEAGPMAGLAATDGPLFSVPYGLASGNSTVATSDVTTGETVGPAGNAGGPAWIFAAAGTYTISVQVKSTSGSVTMKNRQLWTWVQGF